MPDDTIETARTRRGRRMRERRRRKILLFSFALFFLLFLISAILSLSTWLTARREQEAFDELAALVADKTETGSPDPVQAVTETPGETPDGTGKKLQETEEMQEAAAGTQEAADNRERFAALYELNSAFVGWLTIEGTAINYPVMCTPDEYDYYLRRDFYGNKATSGVPFFGEGCTTDSDNIIIYGHNMKNGTMFADLVNYSDEGYYLSHPLITFDTLEGNGTYEIIAVFREQVHNQSETGVFRYYEYGGSLTEEQFDEYISNVKSLSLYDTGLTAEYGDRLLTLSTCSYHTDNGRFVVVARKAN